MMTPLPKNPHPQCHLPALSPEEAWLAVTILNRIRDAIFRAHGDAMRDWIDDATQSLAPIQKTAPATMADTNNDPF